VLQNQGLLAIAFFEATAYVVLLVLFALLKRDHKSSYFRLWLTGWLALTGSAISKLFFLSWTYQPLNALTLGLSLVGHFAFLSTVLNFRIGARKRFLAIWPLSVVSILTVVYLGRASAASLGFIRWESSILLCILSLACGWLLWQASGNGYGAKLLAGLFFLNAIHGVDRPFWPTSPFFLMRIAFDDLLGVALGIAMIVLVLEGARARNEELNAKLQRLTLLTAASTQTLSAKELLDNVLKQVVESVGATHGLVRLLEGEGSKAKLAIHASVGFSDPYLKRNHAIAVEENWAKRVLQKDYNIFRYEDEQDEHERRRMSESGVQEVITVPLRGKDGTLGVLSLGSSGFVKYEADEVAYLTNIANLLGLTLQNVRLFEQVDSVHRQWEYTFDSIGDPILVHDQQFRIVRLNQRLRHLTGRDAAATHVGRSVRDLFPQKNLSYDNCPYCEGRAGEGDDPDPWLPGYFLASNSTFSDPSGRALGTVHVLKDITERKRAEEKYRTLVSNVQEGVFISTPQGYFLDFNEAFLRICGYPTRESLLAIEIPSLYVNPQDRDRLKKLLEDHGTVADFEFELRTRDGEVRTVMESSIAVREASGVVTAYQGFLLDITERKRAEHEIRRRNRELLVLNSIAKTLTESMDLSDSLHRTLRQISELFNLDATSLYLFDENGETIRRVAAVGHRSEYARLFPPSKVPQELLHHIKAVHATFLSAQGLPLPQVFRDAQRKEQIVTSYVVILWSKDRVMGALVIGSRTSREFTPSDVNLLIAVGSQTSNAIERSLLYEQTRQAYEDLRKTQEQLLHSEKMAAVGQLISGVAHELNNPLTAILGYSQLLTSNGQMNAQGVEYSEKLYKQAQRTHRIVQNLLSFARQHKPERIPVSLNKIVEDTLALRDYDLRMNNIRVHLDLASDLPMTAADPHQLQQVFLNMVNNAVDAILEKSADGDLWVSTGGKEQKLFVEFVDSGPGVKDSSRVFDPFYTTKPVGKGTGLGLSICYGIVTEHGGTIRVKNVPPKGASFLIEIPCQDIGAVKDAEALKLPATGDRARILLVDPETSVLEAVQAMLKNRDHQVFPARSLEEAQTLLRVRDFDLVLCDVEVAGWKGSKGLREWIERERPTFADRLIVMSALAESSQMAAAETTEGTLLQKPFDALQLLGAIDSVLNRAKLSTIRG
jgi:two-component system NtrC family sensor kinase